MKSDSAKTISVWSATVEIPKFATLTESKRCDVCIIGGGITGLTCAYLLAKAGKSVVLLEDGPLCGGETQRTTAHITNVLDIRYAKLIQSHGLETAQILHDSFTRAIDEIDKIVKEEDIDCDFSRVDGYLFLDPKSRVTELERELAAVNKVGFARVEMMPVILPRLASNMALKFPKQAQFHVLKYLDGLIGACIEQGVQLFANTHVSGIEDGSPLQVKKSLQENIVVSADAVIVATNSPITGVGINTKQAAYRTYVIGVRVPKGTVPQGLFWDTEEPYHYVRTQPIEDDDEMDMLIVGGEDHKTGQEDNADERFLRLEYWTRDWLAKVDEVAFRWSGQVYEPVDGIGFIGRDPERNSAVYIATGAAGQGMTFGTISGILLRDLILGEPNIWSKTFDPARTPVSAPLEFLKENLNAIAQYAEHLQPAEVASVDLLKCGEGAIIIRDGEKIAACRDEKGVLCERSAYCTHMGGLVSWNSLEKSWDCPVHGSRFAPNGKVLDGPANVDLPEVKHKADEPKPDAEIHPNKDKDRKAS